MGVERTFHTSWSNRADNTITFTSTQKQVKHSSNTVKRCEKLKGAEVNGDWHQGNTFTLKYIPSNLILHHYTGVSNFFSYWSHPKWRFSCLTTDKYRTCLGTSSWRQQRDLHTSVLSHTSVPDWMASAAEWYWFYQILMEMLLKLYFIVLHKSSVLNAQVAIHQLTDLIC